MTLQECYERLHGNYGEAKKRLMNDRLVDKFLLKFKDDDSMEKLRQALVDKDHEAAFRAVHTLKGVAGNLAFTELQAAASALTEQLRNSGDEPADVALYENVEKSYRLVMECIAAYENCG